MKSAALVALLFVTLRQATPQRNTGSIEGIVVIAGTSRPLANAPVFLAGPPSNRPDPTIRTITDASGHFVFHDLTPPRASYYRVGAEVSGYDRAMHEIPYKAGEMLTNVVVTVMTGGIIRGHVAGANGAPVSGIPIFVYQESLNWTDPPRSLMPFQVAADGSGYLIAFIRRGTDADLGQTLPAVGGGNGAGLAAIVKPAPVLTDSQGNYVLHRVPPGRYLVGVEFPLGYTPNPNGFATTFYPGVTDSTKAQVVAIEPESDVQSIDFTIQRATRFTVSGTLQMNGNRAGSVSLHPVGEPNMAPNFAGGLSPEGRFEITNVLTGSYELSINRGAVPIRVPVQVQRDVTGVTASLPPISSVNGTLSTVLRQQDTKLPEDVRLAVSPSAGFATRIAEPGPFRIDALAAGAHYLYLQLPPSGYVLDVHQGTHDVTDDNILRVGTDAAPLTLVARPAEYGTVSGRVHADPGKTKISEVLLVPDEPKRSNPMRYYATRTSFDGAFKLDTIVPGNYKLFAWEWGRPLGLNAYMKAGTLVPFEKYGVPVEVRPNENASADAALIPR